MNFLIILVIDKASTGLCREQFDDLFSSLPSLRAAYKRENIAQDALLAYMMELRSGCTYDELAKKFNVAAKTITNRLRQARSALLNDFVPQFLRHRTREEMVRNKTDVFRKLFTPNDPSVVAQVYDGSYLFVEKSSNLDFQKKTYSSHKHRNLVKVMMVVATDGYIEYVHGPYPATSNDASIMEEIINNKEYGELSSGDMLFLDRGNNIKIVYS